MKRNIIKKIALSVVIAISSTLFIGCDEKLESFINTDLVNVMTARVRANKDIANQLCTSGLISETEKETIIAAIDKQMGAYMSGDAANDKSLTKKLLGAIVDWSAPTFTEDNEAGYVDKEEWQNHVITDYGREKKIDIPLFHKSGTAITPISIIDDDTAETINERFGYKVYVLKPFSSSGGADTINSQKSLDEMLEMVSAATQDKDKLDNSVLDQLFQKAKTDSGNDVTLLDISKRENQIVAYSKGSSLVSDSEYSMVDGKLTETTKGNKVVQQISASNVEWHTPDIAQPGHDMTIKDSTGTYPLMAIRFREFNQEAVDKVTKTLGMSPDQYLFTTYNGENRVYIMEYPVNVISKISTKADDNTQYECEFTESNMGINLRTGKLIKYGSAWGSSESPGQYFEDSDPYYPVKGAANAQEEGCSSFIIEGETPDGTGILVGENQDKIKTGRIVLRDYLEASYAPGVVSGENMVVLGRKLRFLQTSGTKNTVVARYYDKAGKVLPDSPNLYINDFADMNGLLDSSPKVKHLGKVGETVTDTSDTEDSTEGDNSEEYSTDNIKKSLLKIDELPDEVVDSIEPTEQFPGTKIGTVDNKESTNPLFYCIAVKKNMFDSALFSGWVNNSDATQNSLPWWQSWLSNGNRTYEYKINTNSLEDYLMGNYTFELQKAGIIVLDLETVSKIQQEYTQIDKEESTKTLRTHFVVLGYLLIAYATIVMLAWVVDVNVDLGFNILEKLSFGHWVAIKDPEEAPYSDTSDRRYLTFKGIMFKALGISVIGIILILVNVIEVVVILINIFGGIAKTIGKLITGIG